MNHASLRGELMTHMSNNKAKYSQFVDGSMEEHINEQYYTDGRVTSWATEAELAAAADWYNIRILVSRDRQFDKWVRFPVGESAYDSNSTLKLLLEYNHFSLVCTDKMGNSVSQESSHHPDYDWFDLSTTTENVNDAGMSDVDTEKELPCSNTNNKSTPLNRNEGEKPKKKIQILRKVATDSKSQGKSESLSTKNDSVTNLSRHKLTKPQISLLEKGLKFIPSRQEVDKVKLIADLAEWERRMRLAEFFYADQDNQNEHKEKEDEKFRVKKHSTFTPSSGRDRCLDLYIELVKDDIIANLKRSNKLNISKEENAAFYELLHNKDIVIRPADKGSGIVIVNKNDYITSLQEEMDSSRAYQKTDCDKTGEIHKNVKRLVSKLNRDGIISDDLKQYLTPRYPQQGKLKGNPKLHKPNAPYRTIVSGIGTPTERLAELAEYELNEYVQTSPSYIRDTTDFICRLQEMKEPIPDNSILFCFDVVKLYPSIPRKEGLDACREALERRSAPLIQTEGLMEIIQTVLDNNVFGFGDTHYIQKEGIAIGSRLGKNFACAYMRKWDEELMKSTVRPYFYKRFIDDGFGVWLGSEEQLKEFASFANDIHPSIKVELRYHKQQIEFLDTLVKLESGHIYTDLYVKPADKQLYLNNSSCHPANTKRGLAYGLGLRIKRICEKESDYQTHRQKLKTQLRKRGYSGKLIESQLQKVDKLDRQELLLNPSKRKGKKSARVPLVLTYSNLLPNIHQIVKKHKDVLYRSEKMREVFKEPPLVAYRRDKNICDTLVHGKTNAAVKSTRKSCTPDCKHCNHIHRNILMDTYNKITYTPAQDVTCRTRNVVYGIVCTRCHSSVYVGETERELRERMTEHLRDVRLQRDRPINCHFGIDNHEQRDIAFVVLEKLYGAEKTERLIREGVWISNLSTMKPRGCNIKDSTIPALLESHRLGSIRPTRPTLLSPTSDCVE